MKNPVIENFYQLENNLKIELFVWGVDLFVATLLKK
jgi:hypothetical protein